MSDEKTEESNANDTGEQEAADEQNVEPTEDDIPEPRPEEEEPMATPDIPSLPELEEVGERQAMELDALHDRVIVRRMDESYVKERGFILPVSAEETCRKGLVEAVGPGRATGRILSNLSDRPERIPVSVKEGDMVMYSKYTGVPIDLQDGVERVSLRDEELIGVVRPKPQEEDDPQMQLPFDKEE